MAVAFHECLEFEPRQGFTDLIGAARPHANYFGRARASKTVNQERVALKVLFEQCPDACRRYASVCLQ